MAGEGEKGRAEEKGFKVEDRRRFSPETGEPRETAEKAEPSVDSKADLSGAGSPRKEDAAAQSAPDITFPTFVISLSTQALMHLGEVPDPTSGRVEKDVSVAKQMIDIIALLREKTRGNLDQGEDQLMEDVLFDLRMRYVEAVKKK